MIKDPAALALLTAVVAVVALLGWIVCAWRGHRARQRLLDRADEALSEVQAALSVSEGERARLAALAQRLPQLELTIERLSAGLRAGADEMRRLGVDKRLQVQRSELLLARNQELLAKLQLTLVRYNETVRLLVEAQALNARLEEELAALPDRRGAVRVS